MTRHRKPGSTQGSDRSRTSDPSPQIAAITPRDCSAPAACRVNTHSISFECEKTVTEPFSSVAGPPQSVQSRHGTARKVPCYLKDPSKHLTVRGWRYCRSALSACAAPHNRGQHRNIA